MEQARLDAATLSQQYARIQPEAERMRAATELQLNALFTRQNISLAVPLESRVKAMSSIQEKLDRKDLELACLEDLDDLVGIRAILMFRRDVKTIGDHIRRIFQVIQDEDTASRLEESQFGYQSQHFVVKLPKAWLETPVMEGLDHLKLEIQVRTLAQHSWAAASHKLQYKQEASVPAPIRRSIHRVSALLETVDLELDRVLQERETYLEQQGSHREPTEPLNVDLLAKIAQDLLPAANAYQGDRFDELLTDLLHFKITSVSDITELIKEELEETLVNDKKAAERLIKAARERNEAINPRWERGVHYSHTGLVRNMLRRKYGQDAQTYFQETFSSRRNAARKRAAPSAKPSR